MAELTLAELLAMLPVGADNIPVSKLIPVLQRLAGNRLASFTVEQKGTAWYLLINMSDLAH